MRMGKGFVAAAFAIGFTSGISWAGTNLLANAEFDGTVDPWAIMFNPGGTVSYSASGDRDNCPGSGSVLFDVNGWAFLSQCVPVPVNPTASRSRVQVRGEGTNSFVQLTIAWYGTGGPCTGSLLGSAAAPILMSQTGVWTTHETPSSNVPAGAAFVKFQLYLDNGSSPLDVRADRAFLGDANEIFSDGFEAGSTCHFSTVAF